MPAKRPDVESPYYTIAEVMVILKVSRSTVLRKLRHHATRPGELTRVKLDPSKRGSAVRVPRSEVDALMPRGHSSRANRTT